MSTAVKTERIAHASPRVQARIAGVFYALEGSAAVFGEIYFRGRFLVSGDAATTANNILAKCLITLQRLAGGNALIGRQLYPMLVEAGLEAVRVSPRLIYADGSRPDLAEDLIKKTFTAMIEGIRTAAILAGLTDPDAFDAGVRDLYRTAESDGVFCYTFFKGVGTKRQPA